MFYQTIEYPSREEIASRFTCTTGVLYHKRKSKRNKIGDAAGHVTTKGNVVITIDNIRYSERVLIDILTNDNHIKMTGRQK